MSEDRAISGVAAALLAQGDRLDRLSRLLTAVALVTLLVLPVSFGLPAGLATAIIAAVALLGLLELHFALRVGVDAALFAGLCETADFAALDRSLTGLGLMPQAKAGRPAAARVRGAWRLMLYQALCLAAQAVLILAGAAAALTGSGK